MNKASLIHLFSEHHCFKCESVLTTLKVCPIVGKGVSKSVDPKTSIHDNNSVLFSFKLLNNGLTHVVQCHPVSSKRLVAASIPSWCLWHSSVPVHEKVYVCVGNIWYHQNRTPVIWLEHIRYMRSCNWPFHPLYIYIKCRVSVRKGNIPQLALVQGLWLGEAPEVLTRLTFAEHILIAKVRHNCCSIKVFLTNMGFPKLGARKMISHVISFDVAKVYNILPPPPGQI